MVFEMNPNDYAPFPSHQWSHEQTVLSSGVIQNEYTDVEIREMSWSYVSQPFYSGLRQFAKQSSDGSIQTSYLWDQPIPGVYSGDPVMVISVTGDPIAGSDPAPSGVQFKNVKLRFVEV
jgi:hypothetical protein